MKWTKLSQQIPTIGGKVGKEVKLKDAGRWRDLTAYWILGLCNNYGYVVMLSAAHDIISRMNSSEDNVSSADRHHPETERICNVMSTGAILLADIIPCLIIKAMSSFLPFCINIRIFVACLTQCIGFLMVAFAKEDWMALGGVALTSFSSGLGEVSFLSYSAKFHKNVISTWSSGTGGAGIFGSFSYAALISIGVSPINTMLIMLIIPFIEGITFWLLLRSPSCVIPKNESELSFTTAYTTSFTRSDDIECANENAETKFTLGDKIRYIPSLLKYMVPFSLVFLFEYFINQGLLELVHFKNIWIDQEAQYRWLQVDYQIGVFISRSSVNLIKINKIWLMAVFQLINVVIVTTEVLTFFSPTIWILFVLVLLEGLIGGATYVNTYYKMSKEIPEDRRDFALGVVPVADAIGIALAGFLAIPAHNALCKVPMPIRY